MGKVRIVYPGAEDGVKRDVLFEHRFTGAVERFDRVPTTIESVMALELESAKGYAALVIETEGTVKAKRDNFSSNYYAYFPEVQLSVRNEWDTYGMALTRRGRVNNPSTALITHEAHGTIILWKGRVDWSDSGILQSADFFYDGNKSLQIGPTGIYCTAYAFSDGNMCVGRAEMDVTVRIMGIKI